MRRHRCLTMLALLALVAAPAASAQRPDRPRPSGPGGPGGPGGPRPEERGEDRRRGGGQRGERFGGDSARAEGALGAAGADSAAMPTVGPPVRRIATASAVSTEPLGTITSVLELAGGRVLVNDGARRRLLVMDSTLETVDVVLDSLSEMSNTYGTRPGTLIPYRGDSTLFIDPVSFAMLVLDPSGRIARVRSVPRVRDVQFLTQPREYGWPGVDGLGRLVYRMPAEPAMPTVRPPRGVPWFPQEPDSSFVVAMDLETRKIDTLGAIRIPREYRTVRRNANGGFSVAELTHPLPGADDWAVLPDGAVAFIRGLDYRVEYRSVDGTVTSSPKLPFDWQRLTEEDKQRMVDSVKAVQRRQAMNQYVSAMIRWTNRFRKPYPEGFTVPEGFAVPQALPRNTVLPPGMAFPPNYIYGCALGEEPTETDGRPSCIPGPVMETGGSAPQPTMREPTVVEAAVLPNYRPLLASTGQVRADADGNLWVRPTTARPTPGGTIFDIVSRQGELVDRIQLPQGYAIAGFGKGRVVYLSMRDQSGIKLARVRLR